MKNNEGTPINALAGYTILLVEDNKLNQILATAMLKNWGAEVVVAGNGQIAVEIMEKGNFDIILMDIQMPVMDGLTASKIIRENLKSTIPILALSANVLKGIAEKCEESGMQGYISKPYEAEDVIEKIIYQVTKNKTESLATSIQDVVVADTSHLKKMIGSDQKELNNMVAKFLQIIPAYVEELNAAYSANDMEALAMASHKIKSSIDLVASQVMRDVIAKICHISKSGSSINEVKQLVIDFNSYYKMLEVQLQDEIKNANPT